MKYFLEVHPNGTATLICLNDTKECREYLRESIHSVLDLPLLCRATSFEFDEDLVVANHVAGELDELLDMISRDASGDAEDFSEEYITEPLSREDRRKLLPATAA